MYRNFSRLNELLEQLDHPQADSALQKLLSVNAGAVSTLKALPDAYAREYALVQRLKYDDQGNVEDVTPESQLKVADSVVASTLESLKSSQALMDGIPNYFDTFVPTNTKLKAFSFDNGTSTATISVRNLNQPNVEVRTNDVRLWDQKWVTIGATDKEAYITANNGFVLNVDDTVCGVFPGEYKNGDSSVVQSAWFLIDYTNNMNFYIFNVDSLAEWVSCTAMKAHGIQSGFVDFLRSLGISDIRSYFGEWINFGTPYGFNYLLDRVDWPSNEVAAFFFSRAVYVSVQEFEVTPTIDVWAMIKSKFTVLSRAIDVVKSILSQD